MPLTIAEKIKVILGRRDMTIADLANKLGQSRQNLTNKLSRDKFTEKEAVEIASVLGCDFEAVFTLRDTGEKL
ncbi:helix-turn-helix transcriptional regulator [Paenibacillus agricola]|uniref:Helix-turn-helix domain-containing protein n=1 Tax=Paenibacillus agricola TaxID=2716264 RepID=A0ABX0JE76_9BACL|nr:helix-turn-helix domain-containing protein [Paenibacillus agricola]NHN33559.1 helix-turn-helix domain-containing protein [Paenibacillus agricola]